MDSNSFRFRFVHRLVRLVGGRDAAAAFFASISVRVDDKNPRGWLALDGMGRHDRPAGEAGGLYRDGFEAWQKNPLAWRGVALTNDHVLGDGLRLSSSVLALDDFIDSFWHHEMNQMDDRIEPMMSDLTRGGDLFVLLFLNRSDGMSYIRFLTKDEIAEIETAENDRELPLVYWQWTEGGTERVPWYSPYHPDAWEQDAVCLHYSVNKPLGALMGEGDYVAGLPWLKRYSRLLDGRVRLHWLSRAFLWFLKVPNKKVQDAQERNRTPPEPGSVMIHDEGEEWSVKSPNLRGMDATFDLRSVFRMALASVGFPSHWMGDSSDANLATAKTAQLPAERRLKRRQNYFVRVLQDIIYHAYQRGARIGKLPPLPTNKYADLFAAAVADVSRADNLELANAAQYAANAMDKMLQMADTPGMRRRAVATVFQFAGMPLTEKELEEVLKDAEESEDENEDKEEAKFTIPDLTNAWGGDGRPRG